MLFTCEEPSVVTIGSLTVARDFSGVAVLDASGVPFLDSATIALAMEYISIHRPEPLRIRASRGVGVQLKLLRLDRILHIIPA